MREELLYNRSLLLDIKKKQEMCKHEGMLYLVKPSIKYNGIDTIRCECMDCGKGLDLPLNAMGPKVLNFISYEKYLETYYIYKTLRENNVPLDEIIENVRNIGRTKKEEEKNVIKGR